MKKRILIFVVAMLCLLSFAACEKDTPQSLYVNAMTAMEQSNGFDATMTMKMDMKIGSTSNTTTTTMDVKANGDNVAISMDDYNIVYVDGMFYMDMGDMGKMKAELSLEEFKEEYGDMMMDDDMFPELTEEDFKDIELVTNGDEMSFTMTLSKEDIDDMMDEMLAGFIDEVGEDVGVNVSNISMTSTFNKDGAMTKMNMKMSVAYTGELMDGTSMDLDITFVFNNIGTAPTITAPADAADYTAMPDFMQ